MPTPKQVSDMVKTADDEGPVLGTAVARSLVTGAGPAEVRASRVDDRRTHEVTGEKLRFRLTHPAARGQQVLKGGCECRSSAVKHSGKLSRLHTVRLLGESPRGGSSATCSGSTESGAAAIRVPDRTGPILASTLANCLRHRPTIKWWTVLAT